MDANQTTESLTVMKLIRYWLPVLLLIVLIFGFSTDVFSGENTQSVIFRITRWLGFDPHSRAALRINSIVRKAAHLTEYALLAALLYRAFRSGRSPRWRATWAVQTMAVIIVWALLDEYHQSLTQTRTASIYDSFIDMTGGLIALIIIYWMRRSEQKKNDSASQ